MKKSLNKEALVALIMANTDEYKKTHLMEKKAAEVREIAAPYLPAEDNAVENADSPVQAVEIAPVVETTPDPETQSEVAPVESAHELSDGQQLLLKTLPLLAEFKDKDSVVPSKTLLDKYMEVHGIPQRRSGPVMVALKKKGYVLLKGPKEGLKHVTVELLPKGVAYLGLAV